MSDQELHEFSDGEIEPELNRSQSALSNVSSGSASGKNLKQDIEKSLIKKDGIYSLKTVDSSASKWEKFRRVYKVFSISVLARCFSIII